MRDNEKDPGRLSEDMEWPSEDTVEWKKWSAEHWVQCVLHEEVYVRGRMYAI